MRQQLIQYVELLFAGTSGTEEIKQEILQNTLDRYDDLIAQGKSPEAAYRLAISGIGDIGEILGHVSDTPNSETGASDFHSSQERNYRGIAIAMYILSPTPLFILSELGLSTLGLCLTLALIATATYVIVTYKKGIGAAPPFLHRPSPEMFPHGPRKTKYDKLLGLICLIIYFLLSFVTGAWFITWIVFPIFACIRGLIRAIHDLKEESLYED